MGNQVARMCELTAVRSLPSVSLHVCRQFARLRERLAALLTAVWSLPSVSLHVHCQAARLSERLSTSLTAIRSFPSVSDLGLMYRHPVRV